MKDLTNTLSTSGLLTRCKLSLHYHSLLLLPLHFGIKQSWTTFTQIFYLSLCYVFPPNPSSSERQCSGIPSLPYSSVSINFQILLLFTWTFWSSKIILVLLLSVNFCLKILTCMLANIVTTDLTSHRGHAEAISISVCSSIHIFWLPLSHASIGLLKLLKSYFYCLMPIPLLTLSHFFK